MCKIDSHSCSRWSRHIKHYILLTSQNLCCINMYMLYILSSPRHQTFRSQILMVTMCYADIYIIDELMSPYIP